MLRKRKAWPTYSSRAVLKDYGCRLLGMKALGGGGVLFCPDHLSSWIHTRASIPQCLAAAEELHCESLGKPLAALEPQLQLMLTSATPAIAQHSCLQVVGSKTWACTLWTGDLVFHAVCGLQRGGHGGISSRMFHPFCPFLKPYLSPGLCPTRTLLLPATILSGNLVGRF